MTNTEDAKIAKELCSDSQTTEIIVINDQDGYAETIRYASGLRTKVYILNMKTPEERKRFNTMCIELGIFEVI